MKGDYGQLDRSCNKSCDLIGWRQLIIIINKAVMPVHELKHIWPQLSATVYIVDSLLLEIQVNNSKVFLCRQNL